MPIELTCTCGRELYLRDELAGLMIRCPKCAGMVRVPLGAREIVKTTPAAPAAAKVINEANALAPDVTEEIVETIAVGPPPLSRPKLGPPPLPKAKTSESPPTPSAPHAPPSAANQPAEDCDEQIPEFETLEVLEELEAPATEVEDKNQVKHGMNDSEKHLLEDDGSGGAARRQYHADNWDSNLFQDNPSRHADDAAVAPKTQPLEELDLENCQLKEDEIANIDQVKATREARNVEEFDDEEGPATYQVRDADARGVELAAQGAIAEIHLDANDVTCLAYGANHATHLAACGKDLFCLDFKNEDATPLSRMHSASIHCLNISTDCKLALSGDNGGGLLLWDLARFEALRWLDGHRSAVTTAAFSPDGTHAASAGLGGAVRLWRIPNGEMVDLVDRQLNQPVSSVCFSPDGRLLFAIGEAGRARLWRVADGQLHARPQPGSENLHSAAFNHDGNSVIACSSKWFKACKWDVEDGIRLPCFAGFRNRQPKVRRTWITADGHRIVALGYKTIPKVKRHIDPDADSVATCIPIVGRLAWAWRISMQQTVNEMDFGSTQGTYYLEIWDVGNERSDGALALGPECPSVLAFARDGRRVLASFDDGFVILFGL
jgi:WD40 repeat protein